MDVKDILRKTAESIQKKTNTMLYLEDIKEEIILMIEKNFSIEDIRKVVNITANHPEVRKKYNLRKNPVSMEVLVDFIEKIKKKEE